MSEDLCCVCGKAPDDSGVFGVMVGDQTMCWDCYDDALVWAAKQARKDKEIRQEIANVIAAAEKKHAAIRYDGGGPCATTTQPPDQTCPRCKATGYGLDEFLSPYNGRCRDCQPAEEGVNRCHGTLYTGEPFDRVCCEKKEGHAGKCMNFTRGYGWVEIPGDGIGRRVTDVDQWWEAKVKDGGVLPPPKKLTTLVKVPNELLGMPFEGWHGPPMPSVPGKDTPEELLDKQETLRQPAVPACNNRCLNAINECPDGVMCQLPCGHVGKHRREEPKFGYALEWTDEEGVRPRPPRLANPIAAVKIEPLLAGAVGVNFTACQGMFQEAQKAKEQPADPWQCKACRVFLLPGNQEGTVTKQCDLREGHDGAHAAVLGGVFNCYWVGDEEGEAPQEQPAAEETEGDALLRWFKGGK